MIYLDHHAAAPPSAEALRAMEEARALAYANPSSVHTAGRASRALLERARRQVASAIGAEPAEVVFTSGGTEAVNAALAGADVTYTTAVEHAAVAACAPEAAKLTMAQLVGLDRLPELARDTWVAVQWVNHETGSRWNVERVAEWCRAAGAKLFLDATQALGRVPVDLHVLGVDAAAFAAHKMGGPSGAGALFLRRGLVPPPFMRGGEQERGRRAGSPSVETLVGFGAACEHIEARLASMAQVGEWRDLLEQALVDGGGTVNGADFDGAPIERVASCANVSVPGWDSPTLVVALDLEGVCASAGPACSSGTPEPSRTVRALHGEGRAKGALRLSLGPDGLSDEAVRSAAAAIARVLNR
ncbi:MAG: aminotransferase class V-fold PLP-dependent enzyme [Myxococcota bacterium]